MKGEYVGELKNKLPVYDRQNSHVHVEQTDVWDYVKDLLLTIDPAGEEFIEYEHDYEKIIGETIRVETSAVDEIVFAKRRGREGLTRFVQNRRPEPTSCFTLVLKKMREEDGYLLMTAYIGEKAEPEPWDKNATLKSIDYWNNNALIWGSVTVMPETVTSECSW